MVGQAIGEVLAFGVGVALSPLAIVALVVMLVSANGARPAWAFAGAWLLSLGAVSTVVLLVADGADASSQGAPASWVSVVKIVVGLLLVLFGVRGWRGRGAREAEAATPGWIGHLDSVTVARAAGLAAAFNIVKPKNLLLTVGAAVAVAQVGASPAGQASALCVYVVLGTVGLGVPLAIHVLMPSRGTDLLIELRDWMVRENATIIAVLALVIAAKLLGDALISLSS
ncbi:MAG TPA: GAP family protein [Solirubrobacteraceae bacterium]|nr:GAP family protein [Solirubrobacteraceae bacterium]